jgi:Ca-activated chloride channel homolog
MRTLVWAALFVIFGFLGNLSAATAHGAPLPTLIAVPKGESPIRLTTLKVDTEVIGAIATSHITMTFFNPNQRALEGSLEFPLKDGQIIEGFALESLDGRGMLPASAVEKAKGEQIFEEIERKNADPALLSQTGGNNFKLRIYPLEPRRYRTVTLDIVETLALKSNWKYSYSSPLTFDTTSLKNIELSLKLYGVSKKELIKSESLKNAAISSSDDGVTISVKKLGPNKKNSVIATWKQSSDDSTVVSSFEGENYFTAELPIHWLSLSKKPATNLAIIWDASGSGAKRDHAKELEFLDRYFNAPPKDTMLKVSLVITRDKAEPTLSFEVKNGEWSALRQTLTKTPYDGATNASAWQVPENLSSDNAVALLFSDGLANWGEPATIKSKIPLFVIVSGTGSDNRYLRFLAESNNGQLIDLDSMPISMGILALDRRTTRFISLTGVGADDLVLASAYPQAGKAVIAGRLTDTKATVILKRQNPDGYSIDERFTIHLGKPTTKSEFTAKRWARLKIDELEVQSNLHKSEITRIAKKFGLVSSQTSLLVLENFDDYLKYSVLPPKGDARTLYLEMMADIERDTASTKSRHLDGLAKRFDERVKWWEKEFPKDVKKEEPRPVAKSAPMASSERTTGMSYAVNSSEVMSVAPAPMMVTTSANLRQQSLSIKLQKFQPNAPYAKRLREASKEERYAIYLDERPNYLNSTAFYLDVADIFFEQGDTDLAVRILSNLAEMNLENRHILRILAYRLQQAGLTELALPLLKRVRELSPHEPQSYRDLGLAQANVGNYQSAVDNLWEVASTGWESRFADIDLISLGELNAIAALHPDVNLTQVDDRLVKNLPLDMRAVLSWDADNTDIDLWVIDPNGEKVYYAHQLSYQGGRISRDFTAGYGPEEFSLKSAKPGKYEIRAHFYGHRQQVVSPYTTLMLKLSTKFGTKEQKDENIILRLSGRGQEVFVGSFVVGDENMTKGVK